MNKPPFMYDDINVLASSSHSQNIQSRDTWIYSYFQRLLLRRCLSTFTIKCPETWAKNFVNTTLWTCGYYIVLNTNKFGVIPQWGTLSGYNVMWQPNKAYVSNPLFKQMNYELTIGKNCAVVRLLPDYGGIMDTIDFYANMMSLAVEAMNINLFNSHLAYVFASSNKNAAQSYKKMLDQISRGEPAVFPDKEVAYDKNGNPAWMLFNNNIKQTYIASDLLGDLRTMFNMFDSEMGIPNNATEKKERQIVDEVNANNVETYTVMDMVLENLKEDCEKARNMFGIELDYDWRFEPQVDTEGGEKDVDSNPVN